MRGILVLAGPPGVGKTYFCSGAIEWFFSKVRDIYAWKESDFLEKIRRSMDLQGDYHQAIKYHVDHEFLIFDDLGSTGSGKGEWRQEVLFEVINLRYESKAPTIFTTNFSRQECKERLGERSYSRLFAEENTVIEMWKYPNLRGIASA